MPITLQQLEYGSQRLKPWVPWLTCFLHLLHGYRTSTFCTRSAPSCGFMATYLVSLHHSGGREMTLLSPTLKTFRIMIWVLTVLR
jgi:hypothetical protein